MLTRAERCSRGITLDFRSNKPQVVRRDRRVIAI